MANTKHTTLFPSYSDLQGNPRYDPGASEKQEKAVKEQEDVLSSHVGRRRLKRQRTQEQALPKRLPLKINPSSSNATAALSICHTRSPWDDYRKMFEDYEAGPVTIAHRQQPDHQIVAVKSLKLDNSWVLDKLRYVDHRNVVALVKYYLWEDNLSLVYEVSRLSLADLVRCPYGPFDEHEIATICKGVCISGTMSIGLD